MKQWDSIFVSVRIHTVFLVCHCEAPRRGEVAIPTGFRGSPCLCTRPSCAVRLSGLLRRFGDSLLAIETGRIGPGLSSGCSPNACEVMQQEVPTGVLFLWYN